MTQQGEQAQTTPDHGHVVRTSARILAYRRWNRDDEGSAVFRQLMLWTTDDGDESDGESR